MAERKAVTRAMAKRYRGGSKAEKTKMLDELVALTGWRPHIGLNHSRVPLGSVGGVFLAGSVQLRHWMWVANGFTVEIYQSNAPRSTIAKLLTASAPQGDEPKPVTWPRCRRSC